ncbi:2Fe-2S iron-sulfur cluster-binding protein [Comamonas aquatica]|uniref:2Fe-2S iron-sulfur cluster-binding protein n=1 Tax=Comamonas aquatica TaxID=225991 RepID=UPI0024492525|nr:2Fe-2S iron-sulfur cluster-binding protein [Comamonas aquatica]MDH0493828.1 FAD-binding oxidoreductase [Comamonas aquatica]
MVSVALTSGRDFEAKADESLLDAATRSGIHLSYSCKTGRCSSCKCKLLSGETALLRPEAGLTAAESAEGWVLGCVRSAVTDVVLEAEDLGGFLLPETKTLPCRIGQIDLLAPDVVRVFLRFPPNTDFHFLPGQYVDVIGPGGIRRSYSLANANFQEKILELHIRKVDGGAMSSYWFDKAQPNDLLRIFGPSGTFFVRDVKGVDLVFLATGTGIAPVKSILESIDNMGQDHQPRSVQVFWGARTIQDLYLNLREIVGNHKYTPVLSRAGADWMGAKGYVQNAFLQNSFNLEDTVVYACGSNDMINAAKQALTKAGLSVKNFYSDAFVSSSNIN